MSCHVTMMIGLPGSGKSTWCRDLYDEGDGFNVYINRDTIRQEVFGVEFDSSQEPKVKAVAIETYRNALQDGLNVILDNTNLSKHSRAEWIKIAKEYGADITAVFMNLDYKQAAARQENRERKVSVDVIRRMYLDLDPPSKDEGFSDIITVNVKGEWKHS